MTREILNSKLSSEGIPSGYYSLYGSLEPDCYIMHHSYDEWKVFYFDERGGKSEVNIFSNENDACIYIEN